VKITVKNYERVFSLQIKIGKEEIIKTATIIKILVLRQQIHLIKKTKWFGE